MYVRAVMRPLATIASTNAVVERASVKSTVVTPAEAVVTMLIRT